VLECRVSDSWSRPINERLPFSEAERTRFHNLLKLAAESPFAGERENALAAATRLASSHGMSLDEAAAGGADEAHAQPRQRPAADPDNIRRQARKAAGGASFAGRRAADAVHNIDSHYMSEKERFEAAVREARKRGLDAEERRRAAAVANARPVRSKRGGGRDPHSHARVLIRETSLPLSEICQLTGLDIYQVVGLKLKMRAVHAGG
jgi:hypothetical protein